GIHYVIHRLDLHFGNSLDLRAGGINNLLRPSQVTRSRSYLFDDLLNAFFALVDGLHAPSRHRVKGRVYPLARFIRKPRSGLPIELAVRLFELARHGYVSSLLTTKKLLSQLALLKIGVVRGALYSALLNLFRFPSVVSSQVRLPTPPSLCA